jgi:hypothetical protein
MNNIIYTYKSTNEFSLKANGLSSSASIPTKKRKQDQPDPSLMLDHPRARKINKLQEALVFQRQPNNASDSSTTKNSRRRNPIAISSSTASSSNKNSHRRNSVAVSSSTAPDLNSEVCSNSIVI